MGTSGSKEAQQAKQREEYQRGNIGKYRGLTPELTIRDIEIGMFVRIRAIGQEAEICSAIQKHIPAIHQSSVHQTHEGKDYVESIFVLNDPREYDGLEAILPYPWLVDITARFIPCHPC